MRRAWLRGPSVLSNRRTGPDPRASPLAHAGPGPHARWRIGSFCILETTPLGARAGLSGSTTRRVTMNPTLAGIIIGALGAIITLAGVALAWYTGGKTARTAEARNRLIAHAAASEWLRDLRTWASEAIDVLSQSSSLCREAGETDCPSQLRACHHKLSSLVDRGRLFLPNLPAEVGQNKPTAYRGWRHSALDP